MNIILLEQVCSLQNNIEIGPKREEISSLAECESLGAILERPTLKKILKSKWVYGIKTTQIVRYISDKKDLNNFTFGYQRHISDGCCMRIYVITKTPGHKPTVTSYNFG